MRMLIVAKEGVVLKRVRRVHVYVSICRVGAHDWERRTGLESTVQKVNIERSK